MDVKGENKQRLEEGLKLIKKIRVKKGKPLFVFLGTKTHNDNLKNYLAKRKNDIQILYGCIRKYVSTRTQVQDLVRLFKKTSPKNILVVTHAYHIPRIKRYFKKYLQTKLKYNFWPVGDIKKQQKQVEKEIKKIIKYSTKHHLSVNL